MSGGPQKVSHNAKRALELFVSGKSTTQVAEAMGVNRSVVWYWMQSPKFQNALAVAREASLAEAIHLVSQESVASVRAIVAIRDDVNVKASVRLAAAKDLLDRFGLKAVDRLLISQTEDLEELTGEDASNKLRAIAGGKS